MTRVRLLLADDHALILEGFRTVLGPHHDIVGAVSDGRSLVEAALRLKPHLIILDVTMPLLNGIDAARQIKKSLPGVRLLFVTMHASPIYLQQALATGATGYVLKSSAREEILDAIEKVMGAQIYITPGILGEDFDPYRYNAAGKRAESSFRLTDREREILQLVAEGRSSKEIASILHISVKTIAFHRDNIKHKLGLRTIAELTRYAIDEKLL